MESILKFANEILSSLNFSLNPVNALCFAHTLLEHAPATEKLLQQTSMSETVVALTS